MIDLEEARDRGWYVPPDGDIRSMFFRLVDAPREKRRRVLFMSPTLRAALKRNDPRVDWWLHRRPDQIFDLTDDIHTVLLCCGRGTGKTLTASHECNRLLSTGESESMIMVAVTEADLRRKNIEGKDGIVACSGGLAKWTPSRSGGMVVWPNGAVAYANSANTVADGRGDTSDLNLWDEFAHYPNVERFVTATAPALRPRAGTGITPKRIIITTPNMANPAANAYLAELRERPGTLFRQVPTDYNRAISAAARKLIADELLAMGELETRQELYGEIILDAGGALLFTRALLDQARRPVAVPDEFNDIYLALDPAMTSKQVSDYSAIAIVGRLGNRAYVLHSERGHWTPDETAQRVAQLAELWGAKIFAEINVIGDYLIKRLEAEGERLRIFPIRVRAGEDKRSRARSILGLYERGLVHHIGDHYALEREMAGFTGDDKTAIAKNDDMVDALVHALRELYRIGRPRSAASVIARVNAG